jgi:hypothetical protein
LRVEIEKNLLEGNHELWFDVLGSGFTKGFRDELVNKLRVYLMEKNWSANVNVKKDGETIEVYVFLTSPCSLTKREKDCVRGKKKWAFPSHS